MQAVFRHVSDEGVLDGGWWHSFCVSGCCGISGCNLFDFFVFLFVGCKWFFSF